MSTGNVPKDVLEGEVPLPDDMDHPLAWEEIAVGRYMPRRIRGSCRGRVLG